MTHDDATLRGEPALGRRPSERRSLEGIARPKVLIAEDHADTRDALRLLLEIQGYEVFVARDGEEALATALQVLPDVIITDYDMPRLDGAGLAKRLRSMESKFEHVPILVLTALSQPLVEAALAAGADAYIGKPVDFQTLDSALRMFIAR
jgi:two-component system chemotaxis sensor kinase CheA